MTKGKLYKKLDCYMLPFPDDQRHQPVNDVLDEAKKEFTECYGDNDHPSLFPAWVESWFKKWFGELSET